jgi:hypothetical protein
VYASSTSLFEKNWVLNGMERRTYFSFGLHFALVCFSKISASFDPSAFLALYFKKYASMPPNSLLSDTPPSLRLFAFQLLGAPGSGFS